ncbi:MAG: thiamine ABC transporter ATP-binding protein [Leifsonia xyli]|nr:MAG: thiamine ABC transporter ATP-binding protein [Leifsonia xyli]
MTTTTVATVGQHAGRRFDWGAPVVYFVALVCIAVTISPVVYLIIGGFRTTGQINENPAAWPDPWVITNYIAVLTSGNFWVQLVNSTISAFFTTAGVILLGVLAAFVIARYEFKGRDALFTLFTAGLLFPLTVAVVPLFTMIKGLGLLGELGGIIIPQVAFALPTTIIILVPFLRAIPAELEDAATIDGAGRLGFFWRIVVPLAGPGLVTVGVLAFVASWNAYLLPLLILGDPSSSTLPLGTQAFATQYSSDTAKVMAFTTISMIPALVFFTLAQGRIVSGLTGAVKG